MSAINYLKKVFAPVFYPEELLSSCVARYGSIRGTNKATATIRAFFGYDVRVSAVLPSLLNDVSFRTWYSWRLRGDELVEGQTLYPYYARYLGTDRKGKVKKMLMSGSSTGIQAILGTTAHKIKSAGCLRYCKKCRRSDMAHYGETYWRRTHQLPGVLVCPDHGTELVETRALVHPKSFCGYIDATEATACTLVPDRQLKIDDCKKALLIAKRSQEMLLGPIPGWNSENITGFYRQAALERAYIDGAVQLSLSKLEKGFISFYGRRLLDLLQCDFQIGRNSSWFRNIFRSRRKSFHPLQHVLVQLFLESVETHITDIIPFGLGPWRCPNPFGEHDEEFPIKDPLIYIGHKHRKYVASAKCKCGYHFTFQQVDKKDPKLPIISKVMQYGPTWEAEARRLRNTGMSMLATAKTLGVHDNNVKRMLEGRRRVDQVTESDIKQWRKEWLRLLKKVPERSRKLAANKNKALYLRLLRNDRKWLLSEPRRWSHRSKPPRFIDWASRDDKWSSMLKSAADAVRKATPLKRATRTAIIKEAGLGLKILAKYDRYPKCNSTLDAFSESKEDYRERRMEFRAEEDRRIAA